MTDTYAVEHDGGLVPMVSADPGALAIDGPPRWVRVTGESRVVWQAWLQTFDLSHERLDDLRSDSPRARVVSHGPVVLLTLPVLLSAEGEARAMHVVCGPGLLVTAEEERLPAIDLLVSEFCGQERPVEPSLTGVMLDIIDTAARINASTYLELRKSLDELDEALESHPLQVSSEALLALKRRVGRLSMLWEEQGHCLLELQRRRSHAPQSEAGREHLRILVSDLARGLELLVQMEGRLRDLRQHHLHSLQEVANRRLNVLAVMSAIYLPATLIAGIYGMNFESIPMTQLQHGYLIVFTGMVAVVVGQLVYFYRRGWFG
jgi:magnesium transporter